MSSLGLTQTQTETQTHKSVHIIKRIDSRACNCEYRDSGVHATHSTRKMRSNSPLSCWPSAHRESWDQGQRHCQYRPATTTSRLRAQAGTLVVPTCSVRTCSAKHWTICKILVWCFLKHCESCDSYPQSRERMLPAGVLHTNFTYIYCIYIMRGRYCW